MESSGNSASRTASSGYAGAVLFGVLLVTGFAYLVHESLRDWDFYYRLSVAMYSSNDFDLKGESSAWLTRIIFTHVWILYVPSVVLAIALIVSSRRTTSFVVRSSFIAAFVTLVLGYLAAYLPVAKPDLWWVGRPEEVIDAARHQAATYDEFLKREAARRNAPRHEE